MENILTNKLLCFESFKTLLKIQVTPIRYIGINKPLGVDNT